MKTQEIQKTPLMLKVQERIGKSIELWLNNEYSNKYNSPYVIARKIKNKYHIDTNYSTVFKWLKWFSIQTRTIGETALKGKVKPSKKELNHLHWEENKTIREIAKQYGVNYSTIYDLFDVYEMRRKSSYEGRLKGRTKPSDEELCVLHVIEGKCFSKIAEEFGFCQSTVEKWFKKIPEETKMKFNNCTLYPIFVSYDGAYNHYLNETTDPKIIEETLRTARIIWFNRNKAFVYSPTAIPSKLKDKIRQDFVQHRYSREEASKRITELFGDIPIAKKEEENGHGYFLEVPQKPRNLEESLSGAVV